LDHLADFLMRGDVVTAFTSSLVMVLTSELGDKTFFIAAIMAMSHGRLPVFVGAYASLAINCPLRSSRIKFAKVASHRYPRYIDCLISIFRTQNVERGL
jgi:putative Ca2+/H+ antiporter (TMEM165/GDT1 family)